VVKKRKAVQVVATRDWESQTSLHGGLAVACDWKGLERIQEQLTPIPFGPRIQLVLRKGNVHSETIRENRFPAVMEKKAACCSRTRKKITGHAF